MKPILYLAHGERLELDVADVMSGGICGPEWGWITLGELVEYGHGIDTDDEEWLLQDRELLVRQMRSYWLQHPEMAEADDFASFPPPDGPGPISR